MPRRTTAMLLALTAMAVAAGGLLAENIGGLELRDGEGLPTGNFALPLSVAGALGLVAWGIARGWGRAAGWVGLLAAGEIALLNLLVAGREVTYANISLTDSGALRLVPLAVIVVQATAVSAGLWRARNAVGALLARVGSIRALALLAISLATSLAFFTDTSSWIAKSAFAASAHILALANVFLLFRAWPESSIEPWNARLRAVLGEGVPPSPAFDRFAWTQAAAAIVVAATLAFFVYERHPHVPDEVVYLRHAEYLAQGHLTLPAPPIPDAFEIDLMLLHRGRWYCPVPPGWPAVLALGQAVHLPWLVNPFLAGLSALLIHAAFRELFDRPTARVASLLLLASPWFLFLGMSFMPHALTLAATAAAILGVARARPRETGADPRAVPRRDVAWALGAGCAIGLVALIRPLEGLILAASAGLWSLGLGGVRLRFRAIAALIAGTGLIGALALPYNHALTGSATKFPIMDYVDKLYGPDKNALGFGTNRGLSWGALDPYPGHNLRDVFVNAQFNLGAIDLELFGWATGALIPLLLLSLRRRFSRGERALLTLALFVVLAHSLYWFAGGPDFGARYWYLVLPACLAVAARGLLAGSSGAMRPRILATTSVMTLIALTVFMPWRAFDKYLNYRGMRPDVRELSADPGFGRSLVLVRGWRHPDYASAAIYNGIDLERDGPIFAWDRSPEVRAQLLEHYADRPVFVLDGPTLTGGGYRIALGPLAASDPQLVPTETAPNAKVDAGDSAR